MADPVKHDHADDDRGGGTLRPGLLYLPAYDDVSNATGSEAGDLVYATGNGTNSQGVYQYDGSSYVQVGSANLTDSGTDTDGGDNYQLPQAADNLDLQNDGEIQNVESIKTDQADATNETYVEGHLATDITGQSSGPGTNIIDTEDEDVRNEFDSSFHFSPDQTGKYNIDGAAELGSLADGDQIMIRLRNVSGGSTVKRSFREVGGSQSQTIGFSATTELNSAGTYELQAYNNNSGYDILAGSRSTYITIKKSIVHP